MPTAQFHNWSHPHIKTVRNKMVYLFIGLPQKIKSERFNQQKFLEARTPRQGAGRVTLPLVLGKDAFLVPLLASSSSLLVAVQFQSPHSILAVCMSVTKSSFNKETRPIGLGSTPVTYFNLITSEKALYPNNVTF